MLFVAFLFVVEPNVNNSPHSKFLRDVVLFFDLYSNFLSIWLSYGYFNGYYLKMCGCCDQLFRRCIGGQNGRNEDKVQIERVKGAEVTQLQVSSPSSPSNTSTDVTVI